MYAAYLEDPVSFVLTVALLGAFAYVCYRFAKEDGGWPTLRENERTVKLRMEALRKNIDRLASSLHP